MFHGHLGRCTGRPSLQRCDFQPTLVMLAPARWRAGGLLPLAQEGVSGEGAGPTPPVGPFSLTNICLYTRLLRSIRAKTRVKNAVIRSYEGRKPARSFASMNSWGYALLALGLVTWVLQPVLGLVAAAILLAAAVRQHRPKLMNIGAMFMNKWVEFMNMGGKFMNMRVEFMDTRVEFMNTRVEFMNMRVKFMNMGVKFMNMRVEFMNMRVEFTNMRVEFMNSWVKFMNMRAKLMSTRVARMSNSACTVRVAAPCKDGRTAQRTWPMPARGPPLPRERISAQCGAFPRTFL